MRRALLIFILACGSKGKGVPPEPKVSADAAAPIAVDAAAAAVDPSLPEHQSYADLAAAITATVPADARIVGFGELHARVDRAQVKSALSYFTAALPAFGEKVSDLIVETWIVDPKCGQKAVETTKKMETEVKRPEATKNEVQLLADAAKAAKIQPHAMTLNCKDYETLAPKNGAADPIAMLGLTKKELQRIAISAMNHRDKQPGHRPWITLYGGALHNDRFPKEGTAEWSYADWVDRTAQGKYIEIDLIVPEFAEADNFSKDQPWFPLVAGANTVRVWKRGERSFVVILPRTKT